MVAIPIIDIVAVLVATIVYYALGAVWYSKLLFQKPWMMAIGKTEEDLKKGGTPPAVAMLIFFVVTLLSVVALSWVLSYAEANTVLDALVVALILVVGFLMVPFAANLIFEQRPPRLFAINLGYHGVGTLLAALILALL